MITYKLTENIFHINLDGEIVYDELVKLSKEVSEKEIDGDILLLKYDLTNCNLNFSINEYNKISNLALGTTVKYKLVKAAFIVTSPKLTAMLTIFSQLSKSNHTQRKVFSTSDAATAWLQLFKK